MAEHILYGKKRICFTEITDYTDYQGLGGDPLYKRYDSVKSVVKNNIDAEFQHFLAQPLYSISEDVIEWYIEDWEEQPIRLVNLSGDDKEKYLSIKNKTIQHYKESLVNASQDDLLVLAMAIKYLEDESIYCYDDKVVVVAWGMKPDTKQHKISGSIIHDIPVDSKHLVSFECGENGKLISETSASFKKKTGYALSLKDVPEVIANEGYEFVAWQPNPVGTIIKGACKFCAEYKKIEKEAKQGEVDEKEPSKNEDEVSDKLKVTFSSDDTGTLLGTTELHVLKDTILTKEQIPQVETKDRMKFAGWIPSVESPIVEDTTFTAMYENIPFICQFKAGKNGKIEGDTLLKKPKDSYIRKEEVPVVKPNKGFTFLGWDYNPVDACVRSNKVYHAQYKKKIPWYKRLLNFLKSKKFLKALLFIVIFFILCAIFSYCVRSCGSKKSLGTVTMIQPVGGSNGSGNSGNGGNGGNGDSHSGGNDQDSNHSTPNSNGSVGSIIGNDGKLPDNQSFRVAPIIGDDGTCPPITKTPGKPDIISNRLNIYFENDAVDLNHFIRDFKTQYSSDQYTIIGCDDKVKMLSIQIPKEERKRIRESLNEQLPQYDFFIVDESLFEVQQSTESLPEKGWHLDAIHLKEAWKETKGSQSVVVAVVDDGLDSHHPIFDGRIVKPYNVFTQNSQLTIGSGHGTHVAGLAVGSAQFISKGVSGVAPKCKLMPVQVFDKQYCTFSTVTNGILYAIHQGADVVNISIGPVLSSLKSLPIEQQQEIAKTRFLNEEKVWNKIFRVANKKNCILVFAAGNDNILASICPENRSKASINVSAVNSSYSAAYFSNFGEGADVSAPGRMIYSSFPMSDFATMDGTSMAAPIITGTVALMKSLDKDITVNQVINVLTKSGKYISKKIPPMVEVDDALECVKNRDYKIDSSNNEE